MTNGIDIKNLIVNNSPKIALWIHLVFWCIYFFFPYLQFGDNPSFVFNYKGELANLFFEMGVVYIFYLWLLPKYLVHSRKKKWWILPIVLAGFCVLVYVNCLITHYICQCDCSLRICMFNKFFQYIFLSGIFSVFYMYKQIQRKKRVLEQTKKEKYLAELEALKAQINPHFLLNTLNAIYAHTITENSDPKLSNSIFRFSAMLKYSTYEGQQNEVPLSREIQHIENFINLQLFRLENKIAVTFRKKNIHDKLFITPLLLITFVENAFKYTNDLEDENHKIFVEIEEKDGTLFFCCKNPFQYSSATSQGKEGIGLSNTLKRLALIYPDKHHIEISVINGIFIVNLQINLQ